MIVLNSSMKERFSAVHCMLNHDVSKGRQRVQMKISCFPSLFQLCHEILIIVKNQRQTIVYANVFHFPSRILTKLFG